MCTSLESRTGPMSEVCVTGSKVAARFEVMQGPVEGVRGEEGSAEGVCGGRWLQSGSAKEQKEEKVGCAYDSGGDL